MYIYSVSDSTLIETNYSSMEENYFERVVSIHEAVGNDTGGKGDFAVKFDSGEYGYLTCMDSTLGTLDYVRGEKRYSLFRAVK